MCFHPQECAKRRGFVNLFILTCLQKNSNLKLKSFFLPITFYKSCIQQMLQTHIHSKHFLPKIILQSKHFEFPIKLINIFLKIQFQFLFKFISSKLFLRWYHQEPPCQNHKKVGPNLRKKNSTTYTLVILIRLGGLCFPHLCTHS